MKTPSLIDDPRLELSEETREAYHNMAAPQRAWALALAAYETASEASLSEQKELTKVITADDPEPADISGKGRMDIEELRKANDAWLAWYERNRHRLEFADVIAKHRVHQLDDLRRAAEKNLVNWAKELFISKSPDRFDKIRQVFDRYEQDMLWGEHRQKLLQFCFTLPAKEFGHQE